MLQTSEYNKKEADSDTEVKLVIASREWEGRGDLKGIKRFKLLCIKKAVRIYCTTLSI